GRMGAYGRGGPIVGGTAEAYGLVRGQGLGARRCKSENRQVDALGVHRRDPTRAEILKTLLMVSQVVEGETFVATLRRRVPERGRQVGHDPVLFDGYESHDASVIRPRHGAGTGYTITIMMTSNVADSIVLEPEDVRILRSLQIDPRVGFATVGTVLGLSEMTVARRYRRMCRSGAVRVVGVVDPGALGQSQLMVRLRCRPGSVTAIAEALAQRDDVSWVTVTAAGTEITCAV